jgi:hypothetical protein
MINVTKKHTGGFIPRVLFMVSLNISVNYPPDAFLKEMTRLRAFSMK